MARFWWVCGLLLIAHSGIAWTQEMKPEKQQRTYANVEVRGVLNVTVPSGRVEALESARATVVAGREGQVTGVTIQTADLGALDVYLGNDKNLDDLAKKFHGKLVVVTGKLGMVTIHPRYSGGSSLVLQTKEGPFFFQGELPTTRPIIRATALHTPKD